MASSIAAITIPRSIDFSRATASAICSSSSLLALTAMVLVSFGRIYVAPARALGGLAPSHRFRNQLIGEDEARIRDLFHHQKRVGVFARGHVVAPDPHGIALDAGDCTAESLA